MLPHFWEVFHLSSIVLCIKAWINKVLIAQFYTENLLSTYHVPKMMLSTTNTKTRRKSPSCLGSQSNRKKWQIHWWWQHSVITGDRLFRDPRKMASKLTCTFKESFLEKTLPVNRSMKKNLPLRHVRGQMARGLTHIFTPCEEGHLRKSYSGVTWSSPREHSKIASEKLWCSNDCAA